MITRTYYWVILQSKPGASLRGGGALGAPAPPPPEILGPKKFTRGTKGVARIWFRGGGHPFRGGPDPQFFASDPKSQGSPLMYFWLPPDFGGGRAPPPPPLATPLGGPL